MPANPFAPNSQAGKVAVVTGASSGIGRATVQQLTATGWNVYALAAAQNVSRFLKPKPVRTLLPAMSLMKPP